LRYQLDDLTGQQASPNEVLTRQSKFANVLFGLDSTGGGKGEKGSLFAFVFRKTPGQKGAARLLAAQLRSLLAPPRLLETHLPDPLGPDRLPRSIMAPSSTKILRIVRSGALNQLYAASRPVFP